MAAFKGDFYTRIKWHIFQIFCVLIFLFAVYEVLKAEWPF